MEQVTQLATPAVMMVLMTVVGLELTLADFRRVLVHPLPSVSGIVGAIVLLPLLAAGLIYFFELPHALAAGMILLAACPGGGLSNVLVFIAGANVALSVTLTAVHSVVSVLAMPFIAGLGFHYVLGTDRVFEVPTDDLVFTLFVTVLLPVVIGMVIRAKAPDWTQRNARKMGRISLILLLLLIIGTTRSQSEQLFTDFGPSTMWAGIWVVGAMILAFALGGVLRLPAADTLAISVEFAARNVALAITIAVSVLKEPQLALFPSIVAGMALPPAFLAIFWFRMRHRTERKAN